MANPDQTHLIPPPYPQPFTSPPPMPPQMDYDTPMEGGQKLQELRHILQKRKWWVIGACVSSLAVAALYIFTQTPIFRTTATLQITADNPGSQVSMDEKIPRMQELSLGLGSGDAMEKFQQTQYKILQSRSLAQRVINVLNLREHPDFKPIREQKPPKSEHEIENETIALFQRNLSVVPVRNTYLANISYQSPDKLLTQRVVNAIADEYMQLSIERRNESFSLVRKWLDKQLQEMGARVQEAQKKLYKFGQKTDIYTLEDKENVVVQKFIDLSSLLTKANAEKMAKEAQYAQIKDKGPNAPLIVNHPLVANLRQQVVAQQAKVSALKKVLRGGHPELQEERANLAELQGLLQAEVKRLQESVQADYEAASRTEKLLNDSFTAQKEQMVKLQDNLTDFQILKRDAQTNEQLYQALLARVKEANIAGTMVPSNVAVIDPAPLPEQPFKPNTKRIMFLALVLGLMLGVGLVFLLEQLDDSVKSFDDIARVCSYPPLGLLPLLDNNGFKGFKRRGKSLTSPVWRYFPSLKPSGLDDTEVKDLGLIVYKKPKAPVSEAIRHIYSSIMLSRSGLPPCAIMITSPNPGDGKTMLVSNLAQIYALNERPVVLIDCDLRRSLLHKILQVNSRPGLSNYLTGSATLEEILRPTTIPNLTLIPAGTLPPDPANLLDSEIFKDLLSQLRQQFRHILIDTPPLVSFADARIVSALVDGVLLITKYHVTHKGALRLSQLFLGQAPVLGIVLNSVSKHGGTYGGYYYDYQYYKYYKYNKY
jgi:succinoglycan biosynthesis transport protein ExoP